MLSRFNLLLAGFSLLFCMSGVCVAGPLVETAAVSLDHFSIGAEHILCNISLVVGVVLLLLAVDRFKKHSNSPQQSSFTGAVVYAVLGVGLVVSHFVL